jgi:5-(carboxyamino)imidazole ribonucleotide synthase
MTEKANRCCASLADIDRAWQALGKVPLLYEELVPFEYEVSIIGARAIRCHRHLPAEPQLSCRRHSASDLGAMARAAPGAARWRTFASRTEGFNYVGVLAIEYFVHRGRLIANEMAPRVHNSGHWTIEGCRDQSI